MTALLPVIPDAVAVIPGPVAGIPVATATPLKSSRRLSDGERDPRHEAEDDGYWGNS